MDTVQIAEDRRVHWIRQNHQCRIPKRWVAFDTESKSTYQGSTESQTWEMGAAIRWRYGLKTGDRAEAQLFSQPVDLWTWVTDFCRPQTRTVAFCHNLGYDVRIASILDTLPRLGWHLEWCNLDRNVSSMTWRSSMGTLVFADLWTWLPTNLRSIAPSVGMRKLQRPPDTAKHYRWEKYCMNDAEIVYRVVSDLTKYIGDEQLGNWQPTGAGMAYATWRHKFMTHKVMVHDDVDALTAERAAMHTGRAEAWRHGELDEGVWTELDMRNAYLTIAAECELPTKLKFKTGAISNAQYHDLCKYYAVLGHCVVHTDVPVVPYHTGERTIWPVGHFQTWLWDTEINLAIESGATINIRQGFTYTRSPILRDWASWVLYTMCTGDETVSPVVRTWLKHCGRALIGRISLRSRRWELYGTNPEQITGITHLLDTTGNHVSRLMHIGDRTFIESAKVEGRDSLPQVTGYIMAVCRRRLWEALSLAGFDQVAHLDTDALIVSRVGLARLRAALGADFDRRWQPKGSWRRLVVYGPRNFRCGRLRKASGVPRKAREILPNVFEGEKWRGLATDLESLSAAHVTIDHGRWHMKSTDPRRLSAAGGGTGTVAVTVQNVAAVTSSESPNCGVGA